MTAHRIIPLITILAIVGLVALWLYPPIEVEKGVAVAGWTVCDLAFGETIERPFTLEYAFDRISLSYDIDEAQHVRAAFIDPEGRTFEAVATKDAEGRDVLDLAVVAPIVGEWSWRLAAIAGGEGQGYLTQGDFIVLGFGVDKEDIEPSLATGGTMPTGACP